MEQSPNGWQRPTPLTVDGGVTTSVVVYQNTLADAPRPSGHEGYFFSLWMHSPDIANDLNGCQFVQGMPLAIEGSAEPPRPVAVDAASMRWLSGRRVGYVPSRRRLDDGREVVRLDAILVDSTTTDAERATELRAQLERAAAAGRPRLSLASERISLPFDEFIERYLAEPGRRKTRNTAHGKAAAPPS